MPRLFIMRHAKSDWSVTAADFDRPLKQRGIKDARKMGMWLSQQDIMPELVVTSPAKRAEQTTSIICEIIGKNPEEVIRDERIYEASLDDLLSVISDHGKMARYMLITGHNPGLDQLVSYLSSEEPERNRSGKLMTTSAIAIMDFNDVIRDHKRGARLVHLARPKEI